VDRKGKDYPVGLGLRYTLREGLRGFRKARLAEFLSILSVTFALIICGLFSLFFWNGLKFVSYLKEKIELEVFLEDTFDIEQVRQLKKKLENLEGVRQVIYISKAQALEEFQKAYGGELLDVLGENPLPASFRLRLDARIHQTPKIQELIQYIQSLEGVEDVVYGYELLKFVEKYFRSGLLIGVGIGLIVGLASLVMIVHTIRLGIQGRRDFIEIVRLVGGTDRWVRRPFVFQGLLQGLIGALLACGVLFAFVRLIAFFFPGVNLSYKEAGGIVFAWGILLGWIGSRVAIKKYLQ